MSDGQTAPSTAGDPLKRLADLGLEGDLYRVEQAFLRNRYVVRDDGGREVLRAKQKLLKAREEFPFTRPDGSEVFTVKASKILDVAGDYTLLEPTTEAPLLVLEKEFTFFHHSWRIRHPGTDEELARVASHSKVLDALRSLSSLAGLVPYKYEITSPDGRHLGLIQEKLSLRDKYDVRIDDDGDLPRSGLVAAAIVVDALDNL